MWSYAIVFSFLKILFLPSYRSTDFEVHRNWLAITYSLPFDEWYKEETSEWTLDYPPLFAWFEWLLAKVAFYFDPKMLVIQNLNYASPMTVLFQRLSVIITDLLLAYALKECIREVRYSSNERHKKFTVLFLLTFGNAGLILVDHIHFQYNGFLFGVMFLSIARILQKREIEGALWFSVLLNLKHIYLYIAPAYFVYLLRSFCFSSNADGSIKWLSLSLKKLIGLGLTVVSIFSLSFGPFVAVGQLNQVLVRLFPFKRGLCHAYWAPNFWAFYNFADKVLKIIGVRLGWVSNDMVGTMTGGLVQEYQHSVLPSVTPFFTFALTFISMLPCLIKLWRSPHDPWQFVRAVTVCGFCSYMFGWHVHEKAILMVVLPLSLLCFLDHLDAKLYLLLSIIGHFSLFPLIYTSEETVIKVCGLLLHATVACSALESNWTRKRITCGMPLVNVWEFIYVIGLLPIFLYGQFVHRLLNLQQSLPFIPLMIISVYCSIGMIYCWAGLYRSMARVKKDVKEKSRLGRDFSKSWSKSFQKGFTGKVIEVPVSKPEKIKET